MIRNKNKHNLKLGFLVLATLLISTVVAFVDIDTFLYQTNVLEFPEHAPFDGTAYPIAKSPNWAKLSSDMWEANYSDLSADELINLPYYDPAKLSISTDNLKWGSPDDDLIRNAKITYSVPYLGSYNLDGKEYSGSHPAVDIKVPQGTPIFAAANGTVIKASNQTSGFGKHIVLKHNNFPNINNPSVREVIYSSYSHLGEVLVDVGDVVKKSDQIALSGMTGTATTPHLHFQIDNDQAPWHPFWPFTWTEISEAGLNFFSAINSAFGQDKAIATTINPLQYVQNFLDPNSSLANKVALNTSGSVAGSYAVSYVEDGGAVESEEVVTNSGGDGVSDGEEDGSSVEEVLVADEELAVQEPILNFQFQVKPYYYAGGNADFEVLIKDQYGQIFRGGFLGDVVVFSVDGHITAKEAILTNTSFDNEGVNQNAFKRMLPGRDRLQITYNDQTFYSDWFEIKDAGEAPKFTDVNEDNEYYEAINFLVSKGVIQGYYDGTFKPEQTVNRVEALKFILEAIDADLLQGDLPFTDVSESEWYASYLFTGYDKKIVNGHPDGRFKPADAVNKAEFFKILFNGMGVTVDTVVTEPPYEDVAVSDWFAPYIAYAKELGIIDSDISKIGVSKAMSRGEVAEAMYRVMKVVK